MKTKICSPLTVAMFLLLVGLTACQTETKNSAPPPVIPTSTTNGNQPAVTKTEVVQSGSLASPTEAYKTAYAARQKKDMTGLKHVFSKEMISFFTDMAKAEHKTFEDDLKEMMETPQAQTNEVRNEKIVGEKATLEYPDDNGKWKEMDFVKEGKDWKMTMPSLKPAIIQDMPRKR